MEMLAYTFFVVPFIVLVYVVVLLFLRPPKAVMQATLLGGLAMAVINALGDLLAYYVHWWHYAIDGLVFHLPLPFYITPLLIYGGLGYLLIWRFWHGRRHWLALLLLIGLPLFGIARDFYGAALAHSTYLTWDSVLAGPFDVVLWLLMFYAGFLLCNSSGTFLVPPAAAGEEHEKEARTPRAPAGGRSPPAPPAE